MVALAGLTSGSDDTDSLTYTSASVTPTTSLLLLGVANSKLASPDAAVPVGLGAVWTSLGTVLFSTIAVPTLRLSLFEGRAPLGQAGTVQIVFTGIQTGCAWTLSEASAVDGVTPDVQTVTNRADAAASLTVTLAAFAAAANRPFGVFAASLGTAIDPGAGFTELHDVGTTAPAFRTQSEWQDAADLTVDASRAAGTPNWAGIAVELKQATSAPTTVRGRRGQSAQWRRH